MASQLRVVILKPSKYSVAGTVERFRRGIMPNSTLPYIRSLTPSRIGNCVLETLPVDEYVQTDLQYLQLLQGSDCPTLLALVGVQSHQFHRALDLAGFAKSRGVEHVIIGGPHPMTCDTAGLHGRGVSFALSEAEVVWPAVLRDAIAGELQPVYGADHRWSEALDNVPPLTPPSRRDLKRYIIPMLGIYASRGCPFRCNFCSVIKIAGRRVRSQSIESTLESLRRARSAGVKLVMFTSDNFNKFAQAAELLDAIADEQLGLPFFVQCDAQIAEQETFVARLARAGCYQMFVGVESFDRKTLLQAHKTQNRPERYGQIVRLCREHGIASHFSNIIGFPGQTASDVRVHLDTLRGIGPDIASFYILTPIPGTEQYDEFLAAGTITERNLDRFDGTMPTWRHDQMAADTLTKLLFECYSRFFNLPRTLDQIRIAFQRGVPLSHLANRLSASVFSRISAAAGVHPMSGGIGRVIRDSVSDYIDLRRNLFGFDLAPLPRSLELSSSDLAINSRVAVAR